MKSVKELTEFLSAHQLINFKAPAVTTEQEPSKTDFRGFRQRSIKDFFSVTADSYSSRNLNNDSCLNTNTTSNSNASTIPTITSSIGSSGDSSKRDNDLTSSPYDLIHRFGQATSMHGVAHAMSDRPLWRRLSWTALVTGFVIWAAYNVADIIHDFQSYPVMTSVSSQYQGKIDFPAVTICNLNRIRRSEAPPVIKQVSDYYLAHGATTESINTVLNLAVRTFPSNQLRGMGHHIEQMLMTCQFGTEYCDSSNFTYMFNLQYGNCYTFASRHFQHRNEWVSMRAGPQDGLRLQLDIGYDAYLDSSSVGGVKVVIHQDGTAPFPEDGGIIAAPGSYTNIGIRERRTKRLQEPYGDCIQEVDPTSIHKNLYAESGFSYSLSACLKSCFQENVYRDCQCCDPGYPCSSDALQLSTGIPAPGGRIEYCNISQTEKVNCIDSVAFAFAEHKLGCTQSCPPSCQETTYSATVSTGKWPTYNYFVALLHSSGFTGNFSAIVQRYESTVIKLDVYFETLILEKIESRPAYTWNRLLADIGGQLGLLLGFSILTAVEMVELLFVDLGLGLGLRALWKRNNKTMVAEDNVKVAWDKNIS